MRLRLALLSLSRRALLHVLMAFLSLRMHLPAYNGSRWSDYFSTLLESMCPHPHLPTRDTCIVLKTT